MGVNTNNVAPNLNHALHSNNFELLAQTVAEHPKSDCCLASVDDFVRVVS